MLAYRVQEHSETSQAHTYKQKTPERGKIPRGKQTNQKGTSEPIHAPAKTLKKKWKSGVGLRTYQAHTDEYQGMSQGHQRPPTGTSHATQEAQPMYK